MQSIQTREATKTFYFLIHFLEGGGLQPPPPLHKQCLLRIDGGQGDLQSQEKCSVYFFKGEIQEELNKQFSSPKFGRKERQREVET